jgi:aryl sulfotransferase
MNQSAPAKIAWPRKLRETEIPFLDSTLWNEFEFRDDDIVVSTYSKCGTTLTQQILAQLIFDGDPGVFGLAISPWIEARGFPALEMALSQTHRRILKTHLALEELVYSPKAKYIFVGRDLRDIIWSLHNHFINFNREAVPNIDTSHMDVNPDVRQFYHDFLDGRPPQQWPFWSHAQGWWNARALPNLLTLHFADLIADLPGHFRKIAAFLEIPLDETKLPIMVSHCSMAHMRKAGAGNEAMNRVFKQGMNNFINKGTNGRWRDVLSAEEIDKCDQIAARELTPDCAAWLRNGGAVQSSRLEHVL